MDKSQHSKSYSNRFCIKTSLIRTLKRNDNLDRLFQDRHSRASWHIDLVMLLAHGLIYSHNSETDPSTSSYQMLYSSSIVMSSNSIEEKHLQVTKSILTQCCGEALMSKVSTYIKEAPASIVNTSIE
ncbi:hypothetical protein M758_6G153300 [Ceratodon purpureus]|uniref:Uncharacterized protein n=1 Tax=Ceratodon purpureus TaxID=3225 RepID=A0A8T0HF37_CERPU|nr:hypothetical protein KC19_6G158700 [Ceratodon purpureus]KAG0614134.1 hypothetical protein M758_6G153300 [Ceratodon purpureus]